MSTLTLGDKLIFKGDAIQGAPSGYKWVYAERNGTSDAAGAGEFDINGTGLYFSNCRAIIPISVISAQYLIAHQTFINNANQWRFYLSNSSNTTQPNTAYTICFIALVSKAVFGD